jgi:acyl-coenzyme A thioesterase PaaI-like protein
MPKPPTGPGPMLISRWNRLASLPGGRRLFSRLLGVMVPYTGSIRPRVLELRPGFARVEMEDRRAVRNHLRSVHAVALANLAEAATGLAVNTGLPPRGRGILTGIAMTYHRKARGTLVAECISPALEVAENHDVEVETRIMDAAGEVVATARAQWRVGPIPD